MEIIYLKYMKAKISYEGMQRIERYFVPVFYLAGFIESWGRGIEKICDTCKEDGCLNLNTQFTRVIL